jgi:multimeric flavodoxin WrbA
MPRLLVVHHTVSPATHELLLAVLEGARDPSIAGVEVVERPALTAGAADVLDADGFVLLAPANLGSMAGALKHFFDQIYYPCLESTRARPYALVLHGNDDTEGARRGVEKIVAGLQWRAVAAPVEVVGAPAAAARDACRDLGGVVAATLLE